jgi:hypothetical protein
MSEDDFTKEERNWISRVRRAMYEKPQHLHLYVIDGDSIVVCKEGVDCCELSASIDVEINPCAMLTDVHDGMGKGSTGKIQNDC